VDGPVILLLVAVTVVVFGRLAVAGYTNLDDDVFVKNNPWVQSGLNPRSFVWGLTTTWQSIWQPLTWWSYLLDRQIAAGPGVYHVTNVLLHLANTVLLFGLLRRLTAQRWRSAFVALLFAIHPLHVESVAWIAERKDVLSTCFGLLALHAYAGYVRAHTAGRYALVLVAYALGLMAKPMLVTLPVVMLLLDDWPLNRLAPPAGAKARAVSWPALVREKAPLIALALVASTATVLNMRSQGGVWVATGFSPAKSIASALVNTAGYVFQMFWPVRLAVPYPDTARALSPWLIGVAAAALVGITFFATRLGRGHRYLGFGWYWYLVTLLPVSGIVPTGALSRADHYTYLPLIGLFVMLVWGVPDLLSAIDPRGLVRRALVPAAVAGGVVLAALSFVQVGYWRDSATLFDHTLAVTEDNAAANICLGVAYVERGDSTGALRLFRAAERIDPGSDQAQYYLGTLLAHRDQVDEAIFHLQHAVQLRPDFVMARLNLGIMLVRRGQLDDGIEQYQAALALEPNNELVLRRMSEASNLKLGTGR
jgi:hypothetical protein